MFTCKLHQSHFTKPTHVYQFRNRSGQLISHPKEVLQIITSFYRSLLLSPEAPSPNDLDSWPGLISLPSLSEEQLHRLNAPCTEQEIQSIIKSLNTSTAPGPDGCTTSYYKQFADILAPKLTKLFNHILQGHNLPEDMLAANMTLIPKPTYYSLPQNYGPISVLNNDTKILAWVLADRLAPIISTLIGPEQTSFIPTRQITDNILLAANIIQDADLFSCKVLILGLDIYKAFDSILWPYIDTVPAKFGFSGEFVNGFKALYQNPHTRIKLPRCSSEYFLLSRGTRQGCPLSLLIFALAVEPLARAIIMYPNIKGYQKGEVEFKMSLYADDLLMFLPDPLVSLPNLLSTLQKCHTLSGMGVNLAKCSALPINISLHISTNLKDSFGIALTDNTLQYLGVGLAPSLQAMYNV